VAAVGDDSGTSWTMKGNWHEVVCDGHRYLCSVWRVDDSYGDVHDVLAVR
jgi:hypothetical protein